MVTAVPPEASDISRCGSVQLPMLPRGPAPAMTCSVASCPLTLGSLPPGPHLGESHALWAFGPV